MRSQLSPSRKMLLGALVALSVVTTLLGSDTGNSLRGMLTWAFAPAGDGLMYLNTSFKGVTAPDEQEISDKQVLASGKYQKLEREYQTLLTRYREYRLDGARSKYFGKYVSKKFKPDVDLPVKFIPARVVCSQSLPYGWGRTINAGSQSSVKPEFYATTRCLVTDRAKALPDNLSVVSGQVCVGRIVKSSAYTSQLQLVTDKAFKDVVAQIKRVVNRRNPRTIYYKNREVSLSFRYNPPVPVSISGDGGKYIIAREVSEDDNIRPGDILQTNRRDRNMPVSIEIGKVIRVEKEKNRGTVSLIIQPSVDLASLRDLLIVVPTYSQGGSR